MEFKHKLETFESGLGLVTIPMAVPSVTALVMVKVGSRYEKQPVNGISHFLEHMVFKGTEKYPTARDLSSVVDSVGGEFNAFTGKEYTGFYVKAGSAHTDLAVEVLGQMLFKPRLMAEEMEREKGVIIEEINMYEDQPIRDIANVFDTLLYSPASLGWEIIGTKETIRGMKREDFVKHMGEWYLPENMMVGLAGDRQKIGSLKQETADLIEKYFNQGQKAKVKSQGREWEKFKQDRPEVKLKTKKTEQAHFILGVRGLARKHKDRYVMAVLSILLGGNMSSRLFIEVRERRGLAYYVKSGLGVYHGAGHFGVQAGVELGKIDQAIKVIVAELNKVKQSGKGGMTEAEVKRTKEYVKGRLLLDLEDSKEVAGQYVESWLLEDQLETPEEVVAGIEKVTLADVKRLAGELFVKQHLNLAVIGPYKDQGRFEKLLVL